MTHTTRFWFRWIWTWFEISIIASTHQTIRSSHFAFAVLTTYYCVLPSIMGALHWLGRKKTSFSSLQKKIFQKRIKLLLLAKAGHRLMARLIQKSLQSRKTHGGEFQIIAICVKCSLWTFFFSFKFLGIKLNSQETYPQSHWCLKLKSSYTPWNVSEQKNIMWENNRKWKFGSDVTRFDFTSSRMDES